MCIEYRKFGDEIASDVVNYYYKRAGDVLVKLSRSSNDSEHCSPKVLIYVARRLRVFFEPVENTSNPPPPPPPKRSTNFIRYFAYLNITFTHRTSFIRPNRMRAT